MNIIKTMIGIIVQYDVMKILYSLCKIVQMQKRQVSDGYADF